MPTTIPMWQRLENWYLGQPLWKQILYCLVIVVIVLLMIGYFLMNRKTGEVDLPKINEAHENVVDVAVKANEEKEKELAGEASDLRDKQNELDAKSDALDTARDKAHEEISEANFFDSVRDVIKRNSK